MPRIGIPKKVREMKSNQDPARAKVGGKKSGNPPAAARHSTFATPPWASDDSDRAHRVHKKGKVRVCPDCQALSTEKRWYYDAKELKQWQRWPDSIDHVLCPGDAALHKKQVGGFVNLKGEWDEKQKRDLMNLIARVAQSSQKRNPAHRLLTTQERKDGVYLETTTNRLAENLGREVHKAFPGELTIKWPGEDLIVWIDYARRHPTPGEVKAKK